MNRIIIIGGGAAGIAAALAAADTDPKAQITILEALDRVGKKILVTGNGRCNLTNEEITPRMYYAQDRQRLETFLASMPTEKTLSFFSDLGLLTAPDEAGRIYPYARQAAMVLDVLLVNLKRRRNIAIQCSARVTEIKGEGKGFSVSTADGRKFSANRVIVTTGGKAAPKQGSDGSGYPLLKSLGHSCTRLHPCLVPVRCQGSFFKSLKGIRAQCTVSLYEGKKRLGAQWGELQFTDYGLSGIPIFQMSCLLTGQNEIGVDFFPDWSFGDTRQELIRRFRAHWEEPVEDALLGLLQKRIQYVLLKLAGIDPTGPCSAVTRQQLDVLVSLLKNWRVTVLGTQGWEQAQVTGGGVPLKEIRADFASDLVPGLYLAGEVLDAVGVCGGYNLHWAWCSGMEAGRSAAQA